MKRIIFCFDGTSNEIDSDEPTNVLLLAAGIKNQHRDTPQIIYYEEGVGTVVGRELRDGASGKGLYEKIKEAYEFLCFNYEVGDEIFVFGFSRGAYTARSFCGFIHYNGIMRRAKIETVLKADKSYRTRDAISESRNDRLSRYDDRYKFALPVCCSVEEQHYRLNRDHKDGASLDDFPLVKIKFLGVWDTVKTLSHGHEEDHYFHIDDIVEIVESSRHAIATDEFREEFDVTVFSNIDEANRIAFEQSPEGNTSLDAYKVSPRRKHQEMWFPGNHGSVGGGGDVRGLSDGAYLWILQGAKEAGLRLDTTDISRVFQIKPDARAPLDNSKSDSLLEIAWQLKTLINGHSRSGPRGLHEVSHSTILRVAYSKFDTDTKDIYNPAPLTFFWDQIEAASAEYVQKDFDLCLAYEDQEHTVGWVRSIGSHEYYCYQISAGERLDHIAQEWLGSKSCVSDILEANRVMIPDEHTYQAGQYINLPVNSYLKNKLNDI